MNLQEEIQTAKEHGLSPLVMVEHILPIVSGARDVVAPFSGYFDDSFSSSPYETKNRRSLRQYLDQHGLDYALLSEPTYPLPSFIQIEELSVLDFCYVYIFRKGNQQVPNVLDEIKKVRKEVRKGTMSQSVEFEIVRVAGETLLSYPQCCIDTEVLNCQQAPGTSLRSLAKKLNYGNFVRKTLSCIEVKRDAMPAFFAHDFYPCRPDCDSAKAIGNRVLDSLEGEEREAYERALLNAVLFNSLGLDATYMSRGMNEALEVMTLTNRMKENEPLFPGVSIKYV